VFVNVEELDHKDVVSDTISDVLVGVIYVNKFRSEKTLLWFCTGVHSKSTMTEKQTTEMYVTKIKLLEYQGTDLFQQGFESLSFAKINPNPCYTRIHCKMAKDITCGLDSLPCGVANIFRYILVKIMGQDVSFSDQNKWRNELYVDMVADEFCKATVKNLFQTITEILADEISTSTQTPIYCSQVKRIKAMNFQNLLHNTAELKDLRRFLEFAHSALKERFFEFARSDFIP
jgi:hypothetical protein